jgi:hypothetical protein
MGKLARFIWFIWFVSFVWLNKTNQMNKTNQINQMNHPVLTHPAAHALFPSVQFVDRDASKDTAG